MKVTDWFSPLCVVEMDEAMRLYIALGWVADLQLDYVDFVLDSKKVIDYFKTGIDDISLVV